MNIVIPLAGLGSRFEKAGYKLPKPLVEINETPMIELVMNNLSLPQSDENKFIFITQKKHNEQFGLKTFLEKIVPDCTVVEIDGLTEGAACTILKIKDLINTDEELLTANSDQMVLDFDYCCRGLNFFRRKQMDGGIWCFITNSPKWSFAKVTEENVITEVAEKNPISNLATVGIYYFRQGKDFVQAAEFMIKKNIRVNNEFFLCPVYNELIKNNKKIGAFLVNEMVGLGTPEDVNLYLKNNIISWTKT